ncbi:MAG: cytochrome P450 [Gammaproteobacteria bacterium]|nr:cytochrome P450 [Gammaproteobacteria bacterium]
MNAVTFPELKSVAALPGPKSWPLVGGLLGNFPQINFAEFHRQLERWADAYGPTYRFSLGPRSLVVIADAEAIGVVLRERPHLFGRRAELERVFDELGFNGVFSSDGEDWKRQRKIVAMALNSAHLHKFHDGLLATTERLRQRWLEVAKADRPTDLCADLMRYTVDVTTQLAFGIDFNTLETDGPIIQQHLDKVFPMLSKRLGAPFPYWRHLKFRADRELDRAVDAIHQQIKVIINECRQRMAANPGLHQEPTNFLEAMIAAKETEGLAFSDDDIIANSFTLLLAGEDTTANTLAWAIKFFIDYPELFRQVRTEVDSVLGAELIPAHFTDIARLPAVEAFANETMRLKPVAPILVFDAKETVTLAGVEIPPGVAIVLLTRRIANRPENFSAPAQFQLSRWLEKAPAPDRVHNTKAFLPFGTGPRFCPGRNLALVEIKMVLAMLARNFEVALADPSVPVEELFAFTMSPTNLNVKFKSRAHF